MIVRTCKFELRFLAIVGRKTLKEERTESRTSSTTERVEDQETLQRAAIVLFTEFHSAIVQSFRSMPSFPLLLLSFQPQESLPLTNTLLILSNVPSKISFPIV